MVPKSVDDGTVETGVNTILVVPNEFSSVEDTTNSEEVIFVDNVVGSKTKLERPEAVELGLAVLPVFPPTTVVVELVTWTTVDVSPSLLLSAREGDEESEVEIVKAESELSFVEVKESVTSVITKIELTSLFPVGMDETDDNELVSYD